MPYKNNEYKNFIRYSRWKKLRAEQLKREPLCRFCKSVGRYTKQRRSIISNPASMIQYSNRIRTISGHCALPVMRRLGATTGAVIRQPLTSMAIPRIRIIRREDKTGAGESKNPMKSPNDRLGSSRQS
jgi:hypothetical protein